MKGNKMKKAYTVIVLKEYINYIPDIRWKEAYGNNLYTEGNHLERIRKAVENSDKTVDITLHYPNKQELGFYISQCFIKTEDIVLVQVIDSENDDKAEM